MLPRKRANSGRNARNLATSCVSIPSVDPAILKHEIMQLGRLIDPATVWRDAFQASFRNWQSLPMRRVELRLHSSSN